MKNLIRLITIIAAIGVPSQRLTLPQVCELYQSGLYDLHDFSAWAEDYQRDGLPFAWGLLDSSAWIPFPAQSYFDGKSSGTINITTEFSVTDGLCLVESRRIQTDLLTTFTPRPIPIWPVEDPNQPPEDIVELTEPADPNALLAIIDGRIKQDPNDPGLKLLRNLVEDEVGP